MNTHDKKTRFIALLRIAHEHDLKPDWGAIAKELEVKVDTLSRWRDELKDADLESGILKLLETDDEFFEEVVIHVLEETHDRIAGPVVELDERGAIIVKTDDSPKVSNEEKEAFVEKFRQGLTGLKLLSEETQAAAATIIMKITEKLEGDLSVNDLSKLTAALASIQAAFFNRPITNVQVNNVSADGKTLLNAFRSNMRA